MIAVNNKKTKIIIILIILLISVFGLIWFLTKEDAQTSLNVVEKKWIENNKNKLIDISAPDEIPVISNNGRGIFFDFLNSLESDTDLDFNKLSYKNENNISGYALKKVQTTKKEDLVLYQDNYVLISPNKTFYNEISEIKTQTAGVLNTDLSKISKYLDGSNLTYKSYNSSDLLLDALKNKEVDSIILPRLDYLQDILENDYYINYNINEYQINYVITLGDETKLNKIITKYFKNWKKNKYEKSLNKYVADSYFTYKNISEKTQTEFRSRRYIYGFVNSIPYDLTINNTLKGFNHDILSGFKEASGIEIDYKQYSSIENLLKDFEENKVDIIFNNQTKDKFNMDTYKTISAYDSKIAIVAKDENLTINNVSSLENQSVLAVKDSKISNYLKKNNVKVKEYKNTKELINKAKKDSILAIDNYTYDYYVRLNLKDYEKLATLDLDNNYNFLIRQTSSTKKLAQFYDFYLSFINTNEIIQNSYKNVLNESNSTKNLQIILSSIALVLLLVIAIITKTLFGKKKKVKNKLSKSDKLRYLDTLTSLKNRNYLNDNMNIWDSSEAYPQSVIIIDLNNIAYINDNFGHTEGDKVIAEAAGILISNQLSDSEILRTNGNEFLVFTISHDEKAIVTYIRKLNKEFKELSHGFGAAIGYSMIHDEIKTIDDAINEATLDMRSNKEEVKN